MILLKSTRFASLFCLFAFVLLSSPAFSQEKDVANNSTYFFLQFATSSPDVSGIIETLKIISSNDDSTVFQVDDKEFVKVGEEIFLIQNNERILLYDYSMQQGDSFKLATILSGTVSLVVDSVVQRPLEDSIAYRHWFLSDTDDYQRQIIWIESFGEYRVGWDWSNFKRLHLPVLKAMCKGGDTLVYWNSSFNGFEPNNPSKSCDFETLKTKLSIGDITSKNITITPNPVSDKLLIEGLQEYEYFIYNLRGQIIQSGGANADISVAHLRRGIYLLEINSGDGVVWRRFVKQ
jgi:hypothetical protein